MPRPVRIYVGSSQVKKVVRDGVTLYQYAAKFAASTGNNDVFHSDDGMTWQKAEGIPLSDGLHNAIIRADGIYVTITDKAVRWSDDGITWLEATCAQAGGFGSSLKDIAYGNNRFVIVGSDSSFFYSDDGKTWVNAETPASSAVKVCHDGTRFFAYRSSDNRFFVSTYGTVWSQMDKGSVSPFGNRGIAYGNGMYVAVGNSAGDLYYSANLVNWTKFETLNTWIGLKFLNGKFFAYGTNIIARSSDGMTWSLVDMSGHSWCSMTYDGAVYRAYATDGMTATSPDGTNWTLGSVIDIPVTNKDLRFIATKE